MIPQSNPTPPVASPTDSQILRAHAVEREVLQTLQNHPSLQFSTLNVHQCGRDTICIEGYLESNLDDIDLCAIVRGVHGFKEVVNRVVTTHPTPSVPPKG